MKKTVDVRNIMEGLGYTIPDSSVYAHIALWQAWYQGHYAAFHDYLQYNGTNKVRRVRKSLRMAKKVCEDHANLLLNERVQITASIAAAQVAIDTTLQQNAFWVRANNLIELAFALGAGAFVEHSDGTGGVLLDYVRADMIYPLAWEGDRVTECAFASIKTSGGQEFLYINAHRIEGQEYVITNQMVPIIDGSVTYTGATVKTAAGQTRRTAQTLAPSPVTGLLLGDISPEVRTGSLTPRFQLIRPNQVNNIDLGSPLGVSVFANSIDLLEGIDLIFDSYCNEFRLGKKRIIVPLTMLQQVESGDERFMVFDDNDTEFYGLKNDLKDIKEINMELRTDAHEAGLQRFLDMLAEKCGLGNDRYRFESGQAKTATEVISEKSDLYQTLRKNELVLTPAIQGLCKAIAEITGAAADFDVEINYDDSIIEDTAAKRTRMQLLVTQGLFPLDRYLQEYEGYDEKDAAEIAAKVDAAQKPTMLEDLDLPGAGGKTE